MSARFVAVWSLQRGVIDPPELLESAEQQHRAEREMVELAAAVEALQRRATWGYQLERDPLLTDAEVRRIHERHERAREEMGTAEAKRVDRMLAIACVRAVKTSSQGHPAERVA